MTNQPDTTPGIAIDVNAAIEAVSQRFTKMLGDVTRDAALQAVAAQAQLAALQAEKQVLMERIAQLSGDGGGGGDDHRDAPAT